MQVQQRTSAQARGNKKLDWSMKKVYSTKTAEDQLSPARARAQVNARNKGSDKQDYSSRGWRVGARVCGSARDCTTSTDTSQYPTYEGTPEWVFVATPTYGELALEESKCGNIIESKN